VEQGEQNRQNKTKAGKTGKPATRWTRSRRGGVLAIASCSAGRVQRGVLLEVVFSGAFLFEVVFSGTRWTRSRPLRGTNGETEGKGGRAGGGRLRGGVKQRETRSRTGKRKVRQAKQASRQLGGPGRGAEEYLRSRRVQRDVFSGASSSRSCSAGPSCSRSCSAGLGGPGRGH
jgi:hypothetical protein